MSEEFNKIHEKLDKMTDRITSIEKSQVRTEVIMDEHIRRTGLNEENIEILRKEFKPVKKHVEFINSISKFIAGVAAVFIFLETLGLLKKLANLLF